MFTFDYVSNNMLCTRRWGHGRRDLMLQKVKEKYSWHGLRLDVEKFVRNDYLYFEMKLSKDLL